jgi:hypothetical protein
VTVRGHRVVLAHASGIASTRLLLEGEYLGTKEQQKKVESFLADEGYLSPQLLACVPEPQSAEEKK